MKSYIGLLKLLLRRSRSYNVVWNSRAACFYSIQDVKIVWVSFVGNMILTYSPDGTDVCGSRTEEFEGIKPT